MENIRDKEKESIGGEYQEKREYPSKKENPSKREYPSERENPSKKEYPSKRENPSKKEYLNKSEYQAEGKHQVQENNTQSQKKIKLPGQNNKKDTVLRMFYRDNENFAEMFNKTVFFKEMIRVEDLQEADSVEAGIIVDKGEKIPLHQERDVIKKFCNDKELMMLAIENSTYIDYAIPIKVLCYCCVNYARQVMQIRDTRKSKENEESEKEYKETPSEYLSRFRKNDRIKGIITLLIYYGDEQWDGPLSLHDMMDLSDEDKDKAADYKILHFIDVMRLTPEQLEKFEGQVKILLGFLRYKNDSRALEKFIADNENLMNMVTELTEQTLANMCSIELESLYKEILGISSEEQIKKEIDDKYREKGGLHMNEAFKQIFVRAKEAAYDEGKNAGYDEGRTDSIGLIVNNMKNGGVSIDNITLFTGLSVEEVEKYIK